MNLQFIKQNDTFGQIFRDVARTHPKREAIVFEDQRITFHQLYDRVKTLASSLLTIGIKKGDHVCIVLPNCPEYLYMVGALGYIGAVAVPISIQSGLHDMAHILRDSDAVAVVTVSKAYGNDLLSIILSLEPSLPNLSHIILKESIDHFSGGSVLTLKELMESNGSVKTLEPISDPSTPAMILYTSGTTGLPKGAIHTHRTLLMGIHLVVGKFASLMRPNWNLVRSALGSIRTIRRIPWLLEIALAFLADKKQVKLLVLSPFYHIAGYFQMLIVLLTGGRIVIMEKFHPGKALALIQRERVTLVFGVPPMFRAMLDRSDFHDYDLSSLVLSATGAMPVPSQLVQDMKEKIGGMVLIAYGATEIAGGIFTWATDPESKQAETVGHKNVIEGMEIKIVDDNHQEVNYGEVGEIAVRTPSLMQGYYKRSDATLRVLDAEGWYYSGDMGVIDDQGYIKVLGRRGDMIIRGGTNVYPAEVENYLLTHPEVAQAAIIGIPGEAGETIRAYVVLREGSTMETDDLIGYCWGKIAAYKVPEQVVFVDDLPVTSASQKIQHFKLREQAIADAKSQG
jgi:fatty-acyl-CoA synthase/long-chain acyl-CoA synthetase